MNDTGVGGEATVRDEREELRERIAAWMDMPLNLLSLLLLGALVADFALDVSPAWRGRLDAFNWLTYAVFTGYFLVQLLLAPDKARYLRRNWLAAISVLLPAFRVLRVVRLLRAVRAVRGLRLVRLLTATNRGTRALNETLKGYQLGRVLALTLAVVAVGAAGLVYFESDPARGPTRYGDALWWTIALVTTIGSSFEPRTLEGRIVTTLLVVWGLGVFGYITGSVASYFVGQGQGTGGDGSDDMGAELESLRREVTELRAMLAQALASRQG